SQLHKNQENEEEPKGNGGRDRPFIECQPAEPDVQRAGPESRSLHLILSEAEIGGRGKSKFPKCFLRSAICSGAAILFVLGWGIELRAASCVSAPTGLVSWWPGDGGANDIAGANNGSLQGGATANTTGINGSAFNFDGTNAF